VRDGIGIYWALAAKALFVACLVSPPSLAWCSGDSSSAAAPLLPAPGPRLAQAAEAQAPPTHAEAGVVSATVALVPGDRVAITVLDEPLWTGEFTVREDGKLVLPRLTPIDAAGLTITQLTTRVTEALKGYVIEPAVTIALTVPVARMVAALGAVARPGSYALATSPTLLTLLAAAGGVAPEGDIEKAVIVRGQERIAVFTPGAEPAIPMDMVLRPNDALYVPPRLAKAVFVLGAVGKPGPLAITQADEAAMGVLLAGGPTADADLANAFILRHGVRIPVDLAVVLAPKPGEPAPQAGTPLQAGDVLIVPGIRERSVFVVGGVRAPGPQLHMQADRASKALAMAGGATPAGDLASAFVLRAGQRLPVDLAQVLGQGKADADVLLQPGDAVVVPEVPSAFHLVGAVTTPGVYQLQQASTVLDALALSGGLTADADLWHAYLVRGDESTPLNLYALVEGNDLSQNQPLRPGDTLVIPRLKEQVYVMGAVGTPGPQPIRPGDTLMDILGRAGGIAPTAQVKGILVYRRSTLRPNEARVQLINLATGRTKEELRRAVQAAKGGEKVEFVEGGNSYQARAGDVIFVPARREAYRAEVLSELIRILGYAAVALVTRR